MGRIGDGGPTGGHTTPLEAPNQSDPGIFRRSFLKSLGPQEDSESSAVVDVSLASILRFKDDHVMHTSVLERETKRRRRPNYNGSKRRFWAAQPSEKRE